MKDISTPAATEDAKVARRTAFEQKLYSREIETEKKNMSKGDKHERAQARREELQS